jgi:SAM-dependent methyltransferase
VDQIAFSLAVSELALPFAPLFTADNCPTHLTNLVPQVADALVGQAPRALHFHDRLDPCGFLLPPGNPLIDDAVGRVNAALAAHFSNRLFWDYRYARHSALGSGIGSRAEMKRKKRLLLKLAGIETAASVLDVGCGDGEVVADLATGAYTGIDMSAQALDLHRHNNPAASLLLSADRDKAPSADLVLCLDVLIHQDSPEGYRDLIDFVAEKTVRRLIISGYDRKEDLDDSAMCNFFEGLPESLERTKLFSRIFRIARYRNLSVYVAEKDAGHGGTGTANDMADEMVGRLLAGHTAKDAFLACLLASRSVFGWHTRQYSRAFEYPWLLRQFGEELDGLRVAEFGAGISPLPLLLSMRGAAVTTLDHGAKVPFAEVRGRNEWGYLAYAAIDDAILSINGPLTGDNVPDGGFDAWYSISVIEHMPRTDRLATLRHMHDSLRPGGRLFLTLDLYKDRTDLWNYCSGEVVEDIERHGDLSTFIQDLEPMGFTDVEHLIHRMPPSERIDIAYVSATRPAAEEETETEPAETNLDIGGQNNRDDQEGKWTIVDLHDGADIRLNLESESLPLPDNSVDNIYSSHCLEHLEPDRLRPVFADLFRVLKDGGRIRLVVPSFNKGVFYYHFRPGVLKRRMMPRLNSNTPDTKMSRLSSWFYTETNKLNGTPGHKTAWDFELMRVYLEEAGFSRVRKSDLGSCSPVFSGKDNPEYRPFSLYVEARKDLRPKRGNGILPAMARRIGEYGEARLIRRSCALDTVWYAHTYPDVRASGLSPTLHYLRRGWRQGYDPSGLFDTRAYLDRFPGLAVNGVCPLVHHLRNTSPNMFRLNAIVPPQVKNLIAPLDFRSAYDLGNKKTNNMPYAAYYRAMGVDYSSIDLNGLDGAIAVDLAEPVDLPPKQAVMNIGTSEHVVDQEAVFRNIHNLVVSRQVV